MTSQPDHFSCDFMQSIGDDDDAVEASSAELMETQEGFQPVFFDPRPLQNLRLVDEVESMSPIMDFKVGSKQFQHGCHVLRLYHLGIWIQHEPSNEGTCTEIGQWAPSNCCIVLCAELRLVCGLGTAGGKLAQGGDPTAVCHVRPRRAVHPQSAATWPRRDRDCRFPPAWESHSCVDPEEKRQRCL